MSACRPSRSRRGYLALDEHQLGFRPGPNDRLYLLTPDGQSLVDAVQITEQHAARSLQHNGRWLTPSETTFGGANQFAISDQIVINEIMYHAPPISYAQPDKEIPYQPSEEEWIELYNRSAAAVDLSGWQLQEAIRFEFPRGTILGPHEYLVIAADAAALRADYPEVAARIVGDYDGRLNDAHEEVRLVDAQSNPVDEVHYYDGGRWPAFADGGGSSLELIDPDADNAVAESWAASDETSRAVWQTVSYRGPASYPARSNFPATFNEFSFGLLDAGELLIDDIRVIEDPAGQALDFIQNGTFSTGLSKWRPVGNHHGETIADPVNPANTVLHLVATGPEEHLQNHVETTLKFGSTFETIRRNEEYLISFRAKWLGGSPQLNTRLFFNYLPRTTILETPTRHGTPGSANSRHVPNAGPTYVGLEHQPVTPDSGQDVLVSITAADPEGVAKMTLWYSIDGGAFQSVAMAAAAGGPYRGTIPGQSTGRRVQFYAEGVDALGAVSRFPAQGADSRAMYRVGATAGSTTGLHHLQIIMTAADEDRLGQPTNLMSNELLGATVVYQDQVFYDVDVRLKGSEHGRPDPNRRGFAVVFHPDQLFRGVHETIGVDRSGGWRFGRTFGQDEILIYQFFNRAGQIPGMYNDLVYVDAPTVRSGTAMLQLARYNDIYLDSQFADGSDGTAYEYELVYAMQESSGRESLKAAQEGPSVVGIPVGTDLGDDKEYYRHYFLIENNRQRDDYQPMIALARALSQRGSAFDQATREVMDVDQWMRAFAALSLSGAGDNYNAGSQHNAVFYQRPADGKMLLLPFDMDFAFTLSATAPLSSNADLSQLRRYPDNEHAFLGHLHDIISTSFNVDYMQRWVEYYTQLLPGQDLSSILAWIGQRAAYVQRQFPAQVEFAITSPPLQASSPTVTVEGQGWINVREIRRAGHAEPVPLRWIDSTHWQATVPVDEGQQSLTLQASDFRGNPLATATVPVTRRLGDFDQSGRVEATDIDSLCRQIHLGPFDPRFDLHVDGVLDQRDHESLIRDVLHTTAGDANLDGSFNSSDFFQVFQAGKYEDGLPANAGWAAGDWNCDGEFDSADIVVAFQSGQYEQAPAHPRALRARIAAAIDAVMTVETQDDGLRREVSRQAV